MGQAGSTAQRRGSTPSRLTPRNQRSSSPLTTPRRHSSVSVEYIGAVLTANRQQELEVTEVEAGGPAAAAGLAVGDVVRTVNGVNVYGKSLDVVEPLVHAHRNTITVSVARRNSSTFIPLLIYKNCPHVSGHTSSSYTPRVSYSPERRPHSSPDVRAGEPGSVAATPIRQLFNQDAFGLRNRIKDFMSTQQDTLLGLVEEVEVLQQQTKLIDSEGQRNAAAFEQRHNELLQRLTELALEKATAEERARELQHQVDSFAHALEAAEGSSSSAAEASARMSSSMAAALRDKAEAEASAADRVRLEVEVQHLKEVLGREREQWLRDRAEAEEYVHKLWRRVSELELGRVLDDDRRASHTSSPRTTPHATPRRGRPDTPTQEVDIVERLQRRARELEQALVKASTDRDESKTALDTATNELTLSRRRWEGERDAAAVLVREAKRMAAASAADAQRWRKAAVESSASATSSQEEVVQAKIELETRLAGVEAEADAVSTDATQRVEQLRAQLDDAARHSVALEVKLADVTAKLDAERAARERAEHHNVERLAVRSPTDTESPVVGELQALLAASEERCLSLQRRLHNLEETRPVASPPTSARTTSPRRDGDEDAVVTLRRRVHEVTVSRDAAEARVGELERRLYAAAKSELEGTLGAEQKTSELAASLREVELRRQAAERRADAVVDELERVRALLAAKSKALATMEGAVADAARQREDAVAEASDQVEELRLREDARAEGQVLLQVRIAQLEAELKQAEADHGRRQAQLEGELAEGALKQRLVNERMTAAEERAAGAVDAVAKAERRARDAEERCRELAEVDRSSASSAVNQAAESVTTLRHQLDTKQQELVEEQVKLARVTEQLEQLQLRRDREAAAAEESDRKLWQRITELEIANSSTTKSPEAEPDTPTPTHLPSGTASSGELAVCKARVTEVEAELAEARDNCKEFEAKAVEAKRRAEALERALEACSADAEAHRRRVELLEECKHDSEAADEGKQTGGMNRQLLLVQQEAEAAAQAADLRQAELSNRIAELSLAKAEAEQRCTTAESKAELIRQECEAALKAAETRSTELELRVAELALEKAEAEQRAEAMEVLLQEAKRHSAEDEAPPRPIEQPSAQPSDKPPMDHKSESVSSEDSDGVEPIAPVVPKLNLAGVAPGSAPSQAPVIPKLALGKITPSAASDGPPLAPRGGPTPSPKSTTPRASPRNSTALPGTGLTVWGGPDGLIYVAEIRAGGPAERSRIIQLGDIILAVNDVNLKKKSPDKVIDPVNSTHDAQQAAQLVSKAKGIIQLTIAHRAPDPGQTTPRDTERVFLQRDGGGDWA